MNARGAIFALALAGCPAAPLPGPADGTIVGNRPGVPPASGGGGCADTGFGTRCPGVGGVVKLESVCAPGSAKTATLLPGGGTTFSVDGIPGVDGDCPRPNGWTVESSDRGIVEVEHQPSTTLSPGFTCEQQIFDARAHAPGEVTLTFRQADGTIIDRVHVRVRNAAAVRLDGYFDQEERTLNSVALRVGELRELVAIPLDEADGAIILNGGDLLSWSFADPTVAAFGYPRELAAASSNVSYDWVGGLAPGRTTLTVRFGSTARDYDVAVR